MLVTGQFAISTFPLCLRVSCPPALAGSFAYALFTFLSGKLNFRREDKDNAHAKLFACVGGKKHANKVHCGKSGNGECRV